MFRNIFDEFECYFLSDNIHFSCHFERLRLCIFQSTYFKSNNKNWLFLHLLLPTNLSRLVWISAKVGLQLIGVRLVQPGHRVHQAPSFPLPLPCSPIPTCLQHAPRPRGKKSRKTKKKHTHLLGLFASSFVSDSERLHVSREVSKLAPLLTGLLVVGRNINSEKISLDTL